MATHNLKCQVQYFVDIVITSGMLKVLKLYCYTNVSYKKRFLNYLFRLNHKLNCEESERRALDANVAELDRYELFDPRNPLTKRRREESKKAMKAIAKKF